MKIVSFSIPKPKKKKNNDEFQDWNRVGSVAHDPKDAKQTFTDERVVEGKEYYYRIKAVNKAGPGDPNDHGRSVKAKAKPGFSFFFDLDLTRD